MARAMRQRVECGHKATPRCANSRGRDTRSLEDRMCEQDTREWRPIPSAPGYEVSSDGRIRSVRCVLRQQTAKGGYLYVFGYFGGRDTMCKVWAHVAVLEAFVGPQPDGMETRHLDGDPTHNAVGNLAWGTPAENAADKRRHGTQPRGERAGSAKLTEADVLEIRRLHGTVSLRELGARFGVSHTAIRRAATGAKWAHV